ncbi:MAG: MYPU_1760 family metalloprotease [Metamycoplasmataceae bacterium]
MKKNLKIWIIIGSLLTIGVTFYFSYYLWNKNQIKKKIFHNESGIKINDKLENFNLSKDSLKEVNLLYKSNNEYEKQIKEILDSKNDSKFFEYDNKNKILTFNDPITHIKFKDFCYGIDKLGVNHFYLGKQGLKYLALQFHQKITFGNEVNFLKAININDFTILNNKVKGLYIPNIQEMFINSSSYAEKNLSIEDKVKAILPTIFHEYMHHWATCYAEIASSKNNEIYNTYYFKNNDYNKSTSTKNYWNPYFYKNFLSNLNYEIFDNSTEIDKELANYKFLSNPNNQLSLSLKELFEASNKVEKGKIFRNKLFEHKNYYFGNSYYLDSKNIPYYYSLAELIPREWQKIGYVPYFNISKLDTKEVKDFENNKLLFSWSGTHFSKFNSYQRFEGFSNAEDWAKTFDLGIGFEHLKPKIIDTKDFGSNLFEYKNLYPNNPYGGKLFDPISFKEITYSPYVKKLQEVMLNTMGYGKNISQIYSNIEYEWKNNGNVWINDKKLLNSIAFSGYLDNKLKEAKAIVIKNKKTNKYLTFNIKKQIIHNFGIRKSLLSNEYEKLDENKYTPYYTDFKFSEINETLGEKIGFWIDKNNDNKIEENEIIYNNLTYSENREITTKRSSWQFRNEDEKNLISSSWKSKNTYSIQKNVLDDYLSLNKEFN